MTTIYYLYEYQGSEDKPSPRPEQTYYHHKANAEAECERLETVAEISFCVEEVQVESTEGLEFEDTPCKHLCKIMHPGSGETVCRDCGDLLSA